jgi:hypothetical protein
MMPNLTDDQRQAIEEHAGSPVYLIDTSTNISYVLLRADQFEKVRALFEDEEYNPRETYPFVERVMQEDDANDPTLDHYQDLSGPMP